MQVEKCAGACLLRYIVVRELHPRKNQTGTKLFVCLKILIWHLNEKLSFPRNEQLNVAYFQFCSLYTVLSKGPSHNHRPVTFPFHGPIPI